MTAKEYLNQAYWLDRRIDSKLEQLSALQDICPGKNKELYLRCVPTAR